MPQLTYIIPAYNAAQTLEQTVRSVLAQNVSAVEVLIVDDGSTDGTRHVAGSLLGPRVRLRSQDNKGLAAARNAGWSNTESEYVCFLDADDTVAPGHAQAMLEQLAAHPDRDAVASGYEFVGDSLEPLGWHAPVLAGDTEHHRLIEVNRLAIGCVVLRRDCADRLLSGAMFDSSFSVHEDWDLLLRLAAAHARWAPPIERSLFRYRLQPGSMSTDLPAMWRVGLDVIDRHARADDERVEMQRRWHVRALARAIAAGDRDLVAQTRRSVGPLMEDDLPTMAGTLRWAFARRDLIGPRGWGARMASWTSRVTDLIGDDPAAADLTARLAFSPHRWDTIVRRAQGMLTPGEPLIIYGFGRNGRDAVRAAADLGLTIAVIDDDPRALGKVPAMRADEISPDHLVLVTPDSRDGIIARLREQGVRRIILPDAA